MMIHYLSAADWHVVSVSQLLAGPFKSRKAALDEIERRTTRTWVPGGGRSGHFHIAVDETPEDEGR